ncbi:MAG: NAD(P)-dependent oxidoreductase [Candidatus Lokiarchaeota archaeon]|nr:NAD(P)-dependent oxidoreductase [Candidatus Harpocratesius repetitus]
MSNLSNISYRSKQNKNECISKKIGWIGTGVMGAPMCLHLLNNGFSVSIFTRTKNKAQSLIDKGVQWCNSPQEVAQNSNIIFTMVGYPHDVEEIYCSKNGIFQGIRSQSILIDMTTSEPNLAQKISERAHQHGCLALDAPVSGGDIGARNGTLAIMVGGDKEAYNLVLPIFQILGKNIKYMGTAGAGQHTKMSNQILIASTMIGVVESLLYAYKAGNDLNEVIDVIGKGAAASWSINNLGRRIVNNNFDPGFFIKHFVKDMGIALKEAQHMNLSLPGLALAHQFYMSAIASGLENLGTQALYKVFQRLNGINIDS